MVLPSLHPELAVNNVLPRTLDHMSGVNASNAAYSRSVLRINPQSSGTLNPGDTATFNVQDPGFLELRAAKVHANVKITNTGGGNASMDDGFSWIRTHSVSCAGQQIESCDRVNRTSLAEVYYSCPDSVYKHQLSFSGFWKYNNELSKGLQTGLSTIPHPMDVSANIVAATEFYTSTNGWDVSIPLGLVSNFYRNEKLFPARFATNLQISLVLESAANAIFATGATAGLTYTVSNIWLEIPSIQLNPDLTAFLQDMVQGDGKDGIVYPVNTKTMVAGNLNTTSTVGENTYQFSRASKNLLRFAVMAQQAGVSSANYPKVSGFPSAGFSSGGQAQLYTAGQVFPLQKSQGSSAFLETLQAYNGGILQDSGGCIANYRTYRTTTYTDTAAHSTAQANSCPHSDCWIWAYNFSQLMGCDEDGLLQGIDTTGNSIVQLTLKTGASENATDCGYNVIAELLGTKFIVFKQGQLTVLG